jgi:hypothetical protein
MSEYDKLIDEALENAKSDREQAREAFEKMKPIFDIKATNPETLQGVMLVGQAAVKLLESQSRSNEQIIKLAQLKQKDKPSGNERSIIDVDSLRKGIGA